MWLRGQVGRAGSFKQQLEMAVYVFLATCEPAALQELLQDAPIVLLESASSYVSERSSFTFVQPSRLFCDLSYGAPPYAYTLRDAELSFGRMKLHLLLDCPRTPTLEQVCSPPPTRTVMGTEPTFPGDPRRTLHVNTHDVEYGAARL